MDQLLPTISILLFLTSSSSSSSPEAKEHIQWAIEEVSSSVSGLSRFHPEDFHSSSDLVCDARDSFQYREVKKGYGFFREEGADQYMPSTPLFTPETSYGTCAIVSNSAALLGSGLGKEIDSSDFVIRFNAGHTEGFEDDVGRKTSMRMVNFNMLGEEQYGFFDDPMFSTSILLKPHTTKLSNKFKEAWAYEIFPSRRAKRLRENKTWPLHYYEKKIKYVYEKDCTGLRSYSEYLHPSTTGHPMAAEKLVTLGLGTSGNEDPDSAEDRIYRDGVVEFRGIRGIQC